MFCEGIPEPISQGIHERISQETTGAVSERIIGRISVSTEIPGMNIEVL